MNLFRSEEHMRNWQGFTEDAVDGILTLDEALDTMSTPRHADRLNGRYISGAPDLFPAYLERMMAVTNSSPFWAPPSK